MVVGTNGCLFPGGKLEWIGRQRSQERLFLRKETGSAAVFLLKRFVVKRLKTLPNCFVQLRQGQELPVPQSRQNKGGDDPYGSFHSCLIFGCPDSGRNDGSGIMFRQLLVGFVRNHRIWGCGQNSGLIPNQSKTLPEFQRAHAVQGKFNPHFIVPVYVVVQNLHKPFKAHTSP